jgi:hypothetical protein
MAAQGALYQWNLPLAQMLGIPLIKGIATLSPETFQAPILIERAGPLTRKKFFEFFTVPIRNAKTRAAYYRAIQQFLAWAERAGYQHLEDIEPSRSPRISKRFNAMPRRPRSNSTWPPSG